MAGKHSTKKSKAPVIVIISAIAVVIIAVVCIIIFAFSAEESSNQTETTKPSSTAVETAIVENVSDALQEETTISEETTAQSSTVAAETSESEKVVPPTESGETTSYFNATFSPYKAVDSSTGEECSLREVFGSSYSGGKITFNDDGSFTDSLSVSSVNSGEYAVSGESISATYTNDKNMSITVIQWNGGTPSEFIVNYGGYDVYFN